MADTTDKPAPAQTKSSTRIWTPALIAFVVVMKIVRWLWPWPWWTLWAPFAAISALIVVYVWAKQRRKARWG